MQCTSAVHIEQNLCTSKGHGSTYTELIQPACRPHLTIQATAVAGIRPATAAAAALAASPSCISADLSPAIAAAAP